MYMLKKRNSDRQKQYDNEMKISEPMSPAVFSCKHKNTSQSQHQHVDWPDDSGIEIEISDKNAYEQVLNQCKK